MSHFHYPTATTKNALSAARWEAHIKSDLEGDENDGGTHTFKSVRVNLKVSRSCTLLIDSAFQLLKKTC